MEGTDNLQGNKNISILELEIFSSVAKNGSIRSVSRKTGFTPSHVSKILSRLESKIGKPLLRTSHKGVVLTREALDLIETVDGLVELSGRLFRSSIEEETSPKVLTIGSLSWLNKTLIADAIGKFKKKDERYRFRLLDVPPDLLPTYAVKGIFDIIIHTNKELWTSVWVDLPLGKIDWGLYGKRGHKLAKKHKIHIRDILCYSFVVPTYWQEGGYAIGNDHFPVSWLKRKKGHEASTADTAAQIASTTDQLVFLPKLLGKQLASIGQLVELHCQEVSSSSKELYFLVHSDKVHKKLQTEFFNALRSSLSN